LIDTGEYPNGIKVYDKEMKTLQIERNHFTVIGTTPLKHEKTDELFISNSLASSPDWASITFILFSHIKS
jgi:hypothetical protein